MKLSPRENELFQTISLQLGVNHAVLYRLIDFESGWNPNAKNPLSSARGLIQFTDKTAQNLGYSDSLDLVNKNPSIISQLPIVKRYLDQFRPFTGKQDLYMSVFYPAARKVSPLSEFPDFVKKSNPGITTVQDYINKVDGTVTTTTIGLATIALFIIGFSIIKNLSKK